MLLLLLLLVVVVVVCVCVYLCVCNVCVCMFKHYKECGRDPEKIAKHIEGLKECYLLG